MSANFFFTTRCWLLGFITTWLLLSPLGAALKAPELLANQDASSILSKVIAAKSQPGAEALAHDASQAVLPGQPVAPFSVDTAMGPFTYDPATSERPVIFMVFNPEDPLQRAMWAPWSLQMFLRHAPLYAVDYLFVPYTFNPDAAVDVSYYMYREMLSAARDVYGTDETTDEELRKRVFPHLHFVVTPGLHVSTQITSLLQQWPLDVKVLTAFAEGNVTGSSRSAAADSEHLGRRRGPPGSAATAAVSLTVSRLDAWYGWLPSPAAVSPGAVPLVAFDQSSSGGGGGGGGSGGGDVSGSDVSSRGDVARRSACDAVVLGSGGSSSRSSNARGGEGPYSGRWVLVPNATREGRGGCSYSDVILNLQRAGALGVIFWSSPGQDVELIAPPGTLEAAAGPSPLSGPRTASSSSSFAAAAATSATASATAAGYAAVAEVSAADGNSRRTGPGGLPLRQLRLLPGHQRRRWAAQPQAQSGARVSSQQVEQPRISDAEDTVVSDDARGDQSRQGASEGVREEEQEEEQEQPSIPATMVSYYDGLDLLTVLRQAAEANASALVKFGVQQAAAGWFVADPWVGLAEAGWAQLPLMMHAGWAAWWHVYLARLRVRIEGPPAGATATAGDEMTAGEGGEDRRPDFSPGVDDSTGSGRGDEASDADVGTVTGRESGGKEASGGPREATAEEVVGVFNGQSIFGPHGATTTAIVPREPSHRFQRLLLDFALGCLGPMDSSCPAWDHMVQLFACCSRRPEQECAPCPITLWSPDGAVGTAAATATASGAMKKGAVATTAAGGARAAGMAGKSAAGVPGSDGEEQRCGVELGRWATPFRRRVGHWLTDVSPLMAALGTGGRCSFTIQTAPWADGNWTATLALRFRTERRVTVAEVATAAEAAAAAAAAKPSSGTGESSELIELGATLGEGIQQESQQRPLEGQPGTERRGPQRGDSRRGAKGGIGPGTGVSGADAVQVRHLQQHVRRPALSGLPVSVETASGGDISSGAQNWFGGTSGGPSGGSFARRIGPTGRFAATADQPLRPVRLVPLFSSATFDASYNTYREPVQLPTPDDIRAAAVVSYITGHGYDASNCAEFCPTSHHLFINGREFAVLNFTDAATEWGCADAVLYGGVPNEHGTWLYGRGGWCDGAAVNPWVVDVSEVLLPPGSERNNTIWYKGLYGGSLDPVDPPEGVAPGYIMLQMVLVFYT